MHSVRARHTRVSDPLRVFQNTYAIEKGIFLHILDYFTPYMAHITTLVPADSKIRTF